MQISPAIGQLGLGWPVGVAVVGDVRTSLEAFAPELGVETDTTISGFGAVTVTLTAVADAAAVMAEAQHRSGPTVVFIQREA